MFKPVNSRVSFPQLEESLLAWWKEQDVFRRSIAARQGGPRFVLFDGPPTVNGSPALHHVLTSVFKDVIPRYKVMKGFYAPRIGGWDTHGLPVELEVEKQLGISSKPQIEAYGVDRFNELCRQSVYKYVHEFEEVIRRVGYWVDLDNAYITLKNEYIESCWWAIKQMWDRELVYKGYRVTPHCPRCGTSLSSHEVAQGYKEDTEDPSVYIKFKVAGKSPAGLPGGKPVYLLAWTTTPWTLPGNTALAVSPDAEYAVMEGSEDYLIMAARLVGAVGLEGYHEAKKVPGQELVGTAYTPLFNPHDFAVERLRFQEGGSLKAQPAVKKLTYRVISGDFVTMDEGTGIVHIAPAYGEVDHEAGKTWGLDFVQQVDLQGKIIGRYPFAGKFVKDADPMIMEDLKNRGLLFRRGTIRHTYPFCWRCETPLLYYAKETWWDEIYHLSPGMCSSLAWHDTGVEIYKNFDFKNWSLPVYLYALNGEKSEVDDNEGKSLLIHVAPELFGSKLKLLGSLGWGTWDTKDDNDVTRYALGFDWKYQKFNLKGEYLHGEWDNRPYFGGGVKDASREAYYVRALYRFTPKWRGLIDYSHARNYVTASGNFTGEYDSYDTTTLGVDYFVTESSAIIGQLMLGNGKRSDGSEKLDYTRFTLGWRTTF